MWGIGGYSGGNSGGYSGGTTGGTSYDATPAYRPEPAHHPDPRPKSAIGSVASALGGLMADLDASVKTVRVVVDCAKVHCVTVVVVLTDLELVLCSIFVPSLFHLCSIFVPYAFKVQHIAPRRRYTITKADGKLVSRDDHGNIGLSVDSDVAASSSRNGRLL